MRVIYADEIFFLNAVIDYLILLTSAKICAISISRFRLLSAACFGGIYAVFSALDKSTFLCLPIIKIIAGILLLLIAFYGEKYLLRAGLVFFAVSAAFGGAILALSLLGGKPGELYTVIDSKVLLVAFAVCYTILTAVFGRIARRTTGGGVAWLQIWAFGKEVKMWALRDTGNSLTDPLTGHTVVVTGVKTLRKLIPEELKNLLTETMLKNPIQVMENIANTAFAPYFRLLPYSSVGMPYGMLVAFRAERVAVDGKTISKVLVALSPNEVAEGSTYSAIIGS